MLKKLIFGFLIFSSFRVEAQTPPSPLPSAHNKTLKMPYAQMALTAKLVGVAISDPNWYNWCNSPIKGKDGKIHIFGSRWPSKDGMEGWISNEAEIAHFVADKPEGPFKFVSTVLKTAMFPDQGKMFAPHNPRIEYVDGKYILLYIIQTKKNEVKMEIGMMVAENINGPWRFAKNNNGIVVKMAKNPNQWNYQSAIGVDNPAFLKIGKKYCIYFKSGAPKQLDAKYGMATADHLEGPYISQNTPVTDNTSYIEDAQAFSVHGKYYLLTTDNLGGNTGVYGNIILWTSETGNSFKLKDAKIGMGNILDYWGTKNDHQKLLATPGHFERDKSGKLERPSILILNGKPAYFYATSGLNINGGGVSETYVFKIGWNNGK